MSDNHEIHNLQYVIKELREALEWYAENTMVPERALKALKALEKTGE